MTKKTEVITGHTDKNSTRLIGAYTDPKQSTDEWDTITNILRLRTDVSTKFRWDRGRWDKGRWN